MINKLDLEAYKFVNKLCQFTLPDNYNAKTEKTDLKGINKIADLGEVSNFCIEEFDEDTYLTKRKFKDINGELIGLDTLDFSEFILFISKYFDNSFFTDNCDFKTLLDLSFEWLIEGHKYKKGFENLSSYLIDNINSLKKEYHFYFKIESIAIEDTIYIGNTVIKFFNNDEINQFYNQLLDDNPEKTLDYFKDFYNKHFNSINAFIKVNSVENRAQEIAFYEVELAIDVLKCFCCQYSTEKLFQIFDLDYRFKQESKAKYLFLPNGNINDCTFQIENLGGVLPIEITKTFLKNAELNGLKLFSDFIKLKRNTNLYHNTIDLIKQFSNIISTFNNYEKVVKAISLFESFCVPKGSSKSNGETHLKKKIVPKLIQNEKEQETLKKLIRQHYEIRDRFLHNYFQDPSLNKKDLTLLLEYQRLFILKIIELNKQFDTLSEALTYFDIQ